MLNAIILLASGILGMLAVNLIEIDKLNQASDQNTNLKKYLSKHWANMALSLIMVIASIIARTYVKSLEDAGWTLLGGTFAIGMAGPTVAQFIRDQTINRFKSAQ
jgi:hypothetical protein